MSIVGINAMTIAAFAVVVALFALALRGRSWTLWLAGYTATLLTLVLAWRSR